MIEYKKARKLDDLVVAEYPDQLIVSHKEGKDQGSLCLRPEEFDSLSGPQILKRFNAYIDSILNGIVSDRPVEIAYGKPQLRWNKACRQLEMFCAVRSAGIQRDRREQSRSKLTINFCQAKNF